MGNAILCQPSGTKRRSSRRSKKKLHATGDAFLCSAEIGDERMMQALHSANQELDLLQYTDISGQTALHYAAADGQLKCVEFLLTNGCDLNVRDVWQRTPLMKAIVNKQREAAQFLVDHGCDVNLADSINSSALHVAASYGDAGFISLLISANARVDVVDSKQRQPLYYAVLNSAVEVVCLLLGRGATAYVYDDAGLSVNDSDSEADGEFEFPVGSSQSSRRVQLLERRARPPNRSNVGQSATSRAQSASRAENNASRSQPIANVNAGGNARSGHGRNTHTGRNREQESDLSRAVSRNALVLSGANVQLSPMQLAVYQLCRRTRANSNSVGAIVRKASVVRMFLSECVVDFETWLGWFTTYSDKDASELCVHHLLHAAVMSGPPRRLRNAATWTNTSTNNLRTPNSTRSSHSLANQMATAHSAALLTNYLDTMRRLNYVDETVDQDELLCCVSGRAVFTLKNLCRLRIRALLAHRNGVTNIGPFFGRLPIPFALNQYLRLEDLLDTWHRLSYQS